jgi:hypothetical protein
MAAIPAAPKENAGAGNPILFLVSDSGGSLVANLLRAYQAGTLDAQPVGDLGVYPTSGKLKNGNRSLTSTAALQLSTSSVPCQGVLVKAREGNVNDVWVGISTVTADTTEATGGWRLKPGASIGLPCRDLQEVYIRCATYTAGDGVEFIASID